VHPRRPLIAAATLALLLLLLLVQCLSLRAVHAATPESTLQVLHWWTSLSERKAVEALSRRLAAEGITWQDAAIPGGAGQGAGKVLRGRVLAGNAPEVTQIIGVPLREWAEIGVLLELDAVAAAGNWAELLFPTVFGLIQHRRHVVATPLGIHRINTLFYNRPLFARFKLPPPTTWADFERAALRLKSAGVTPLAQSTEPWQVAGLFETLVLMDGGPALHRDLFARHSVPAAADPRLLGALERLRALKGWMAQPAVELPWTGMLQQVVRGEAAMLVMGDWAKGELNELRAAGVDEDVACLPMPGTGRYHLFAVDTLAMFAGDYSHTAAQEKLARLAMQPAMQAEYNAIKGSVPVRRDADVSRMDSCARASWTSFAQDPASQVASLTHRMATSDASRDAIMAEVHRYFVDDAVAPAEAQRRLAAIFRALQARQAAPASN
jgi:glucose/mannose transport system substrate-binding protein